MRVGIDIGGTKCLGVMLDANGEVKRFINIFINETEIRTLQGLATPVQENDQVSIVPAMAGGN